jgi:adenylate cyclase
VSGRRPAGAARASMFRGTGTRTRRLGALLERRRRTRREDRAALDRACFPALFTKRAIVFTDTSDFTTRTARDGILHFLMVFDEAVAGARGVVARTRGEVVKVEGDSLLLRFESVRDACRSVEEMERLLARLNRRRPENEMVRFSYGIGYGDVLDLEQDMFGLEVNLASKLGEDLAKPGQALLTPSAGAALDPPTFKRVVLHKIVTFGRSAIPVVRLRLRR